AASERRLRRLKRGAVVLEDLIEAGHADVGSAVLDVNRHVAILHEHPLDPAAGEHELARAEIALRRHVVARGGEERERVFLQSSFWNRYSHKSSTVNVNPIAGTL